MSVTVDVLINNKSWTSHNPNIESYLKDLASNIIPQTKLSQLLQNNVEIEVSIVLCDDKEIQSLNKKYRNQDKPTNVLSFPVMDFKEISNIEDFAAIGDIILSFETIKRESVEQNKIFNNHLAHLFIHSILHLIGHDHENDDQAKIMEDLEIELLKKLEIDNPYITN